MMRTRTACLALALVAAALTGCAAPAAEPADVLATFYPLWFAASQIAGDDLRVGTLVPSGVEPHDWEPSPRDVARVGSARVVVTQGAAFEPWLAGLLESARGERVVVDTTADLPLREGGAHEEDEAAEGEAHEGEALDPHTWLDPALFARQVTAIEDALVAQWPEHEAGFRARAEALRERLAALDASFAAGLEGCEISVVVANHDAYGYLAARHGFHVEAVHGLSPESEPSPSDMARVIDVAREHNITIVFFEELASPRVAQAIAREVGAQTRVLSPVEGIPEDEQARGEDYFTRMEANLANLREALRCP